MKLLLKLFFIFRRNKLFIFIIACLFLSSFFLTRSYSVEESKPKDTVLVSIAPYKFFVDYISDKTIPVTVLVSSGSSPHTYDPTPKQTLNLGYASIWITSSDPFEYQLKKVLKEHNPNIDIVDTLSGLDLIYHNHHNHQCTCTQQEGADPHTWLSPKIAKEQVKLIANVLIKHYPEREALFHRKLGDLLQELNQLDDYISNLLKMNKNRTVMVSHAAFAYFCRDYNLNQLSIEYEGHDPSAQELTKIIQQARQANIERIFSQRQYNTKAAERIAQELRITTIDLDPYAEDYINNLRNIAENFAELKAS